MTEQTKGDLDAAESAAEQYKQQLALLQQSRQQALDEAGDKWGNAVNTVTEIPVLPKKLDVYVSMFGVAWMPFYLVKSADQTVEIPAFA